jgi:hypothetical protein
MQVIAFVKEDGLVFASGEIKSISAPEFTRNYDTEMVIGIEYAKPIARAIAPAELTATLRDFNKNRGLKRYVEKAFNLSTIVTMMILEVEAINDIRAESDADFYSGYINLPGRNISPDKADESTLKLQISDAWRTENGIVVWRLPTGRSSTIGIEMVHG